jgi:hypothetical protein
LAKRMLENEGLRLANEAKELRAEEKARMDVHRILIEKRLLDIKFVQEFMKTMDSQGISKQEQQRLLQSLVLEPLKPIEDFVLSGHLRQAAVVQ